MCDQQGVSVNGYGNRGESITEIQHIVIWDEARHGPSTVFPASSILLECQAHML